MAPEHQAHVHDLRFLLVDATLDLRLGLGEYFGVRATVPVRMVDVDPTFEDAEGRTLDDFESIHHRDETIAGLGDVGADAVFWTGGDDWAGTARIGLTFPTGNTEEDPFTRGEAGLEHQHIFLGSGTFDPRLAVAGAYRLPSVRLSADLEARGALYENHHGYRAGWMVAGGLGASSGFGLTAWRFGVRLGALREWPSKWSGRDARNSGRIDLLPSVSVNWRPAPAWGLNLQLIRPVVLAVEGGQLEMPFVIHLGVSRRFALWGG